jgi:hypothetical protein
VPVARARNIKPGFFTNDELALCEHGARLVFVGLWCIADREGRLEDRPLRIKAQLMPFDNCDIDQWLEQLHEKRFITRYEVANCKYIQVNNFHKHQNPHVKESASTIPAPGLHQTSTGNSGTSPADSLLPITDSLLLNPDTLIQHDPICFGMAWASYPAGGRSKREAAVPAWDEAIGKLTSRCGGHRLAGEWLLDRVKAFSRSPLAATRFCPSIATWLADGRYDDDEEAWARGDGPPPKPKPRLPTEEELANYNPNGGAA